MSARRSPEASAKKKASILEDRLHWLDAQIDAHPGDRRYHWWEAEARALDFALRVIDSCPETAQAVILKMRDEQYLRDVAA